MGDSEENEKCSQDKIGRDSWIPPYEFFDSSSEFIDDTNPGSSAAAADEVRETKVDNFPTAVCNSVTIGESCAFPDNCKQDGDLGSNGTDVASDDQAVPNNENVAILKRLFWISTAGLFLMFGFMPKVIYMLETLHSLQLFFRNFDSEEKNTCYCLSNAMQQTLQVTLQLSISLVSLFWIKRQMKPWVDKILSKSDMKHSLRGHWMFQVRISVNNFNLTVLPVSGIPSKTQNKEDDQQQVPHPPNAEEEADLNHMSLEQADEEENDPSNQIRITSRGDTEDETRVQTKYSNGNDVPLGPGESGYCTNNQLSVSGSFPCNIAFKLPCENDGNNPGNLVIPLNELTEMIDTHLKDCKNAECLKEFRPQNADFNSGPDRCDNRNVEHGTIDDIIRSVETGKKGGIIIDEELFRSVNQKTFELGKEYQKVGKKGDNILCKTNHGFEFMLKRIPKDLFSIDQLRNYLRPGHQQRFLPTFYGIFMDEAFVDVFLSHRNGVSLAQVLLGQHMRTMMQKLMFVTYLLEGIQVLHKQGIALLGVNSGCIDLDNEQDPSSLMFTNVQFSEHRRRLDRIFPVYSPPEPVQQPSWLSCKRYDMWGAGGVIFRLFTGESIWFQELIGLKRAFPGDSVIVDKLIEQIQTEAWNVQQKVMNIDQRPHRILPAVVHLLLCLLNPNEERRATSEDILLHALFHFSTSTGSGPSLECSLRRVSTKGHKRRHCIVTVTNKVDILYVAVVPRGYTMHQLLTDSSFLNQVPVIRRFYSPWPDCSNPCTFEEDTVLEMDFW